MVCTKVCIFALLFGSCLWAYIIGSACTILSTLDVETIEHQHLMDQLNVMMENHNMADELRSELRTYFIQALRATLGLVESH